MGNGKRTVVCLKWGTLYSHEHVNRLHRGVRRNLAGPFSFICFTDDPEGIEAGVEVRRLNDLGIRKTPIPSIWTKLTLPHPEAGLEGTCLFIDLDVVIWGRIDEFFEYPGEFCIIHNWIERRKQLFRERPRIGNSSVYRFEAGTHPGLVEKCSSDPGCAERNFPTEQAFLTKSIDGEVRWWPKERVRSFKRHCIPTFPLNWILKPTVPEGRRFWLSTGGRSRRRQWRGIAAGRTRGAWPARRSGESGLRIDREIPPRLILICPIPSVASDAIQSESVTDARQTGITHPTAIHQ